MLPSNRGLLGDSHGKLQVKIQEGILVLFFFFKFYTVL